MAATKTTVMEEQIGQGWQWVMPPTNHAGQGNAGQVTGKVIAVACRWEQRLNPARSMSARQGYVCGAGVYVCVWQARSRVAATAATGCTTGRRGYATQAQGVNVTRGGKGYAAQRNRYARKVVKGRQVNRTVPAVR